MKTKNISISFVEDEMSINDDVMQMLDDYRHEQDEYFAELESMLEDGILPRFLEMRTILASATKTLPYIPR